MYQNLPRDLNQYALSFLDAQTLARLSQSSKKYNKQLPELLAKKKIEKLLTQYPRLKKGETFAEYFTRFNNELLYYLYDRDNKKESINSLLPIWSTHRWELPLIVASAEGLEQVVKWIIAKINNDITEITRRDKDYSCLWTTALHTAAEKGHLLIVQLLLDAGVPVDLCVEKNKWGKIERISSYSQEFDYGNTPLFVAAKNGHENMVRLLHDRGANINTDRVNAFLQDFGNGNEDSYYEMSTPIISAAINNHVACVRFLLEKDSKVDFLNSFEYFLHGKLYKSQIGRQLSEYGVFTKSAGILLGIGIIKKCINMANNTPENNAHNMADKYLDLANLCIKRIQSARVGYDMFKSSLKEIFERDTFPCRFKSAELLVFLSLPAMKEWSDPDILSDIGKVLRDGIKMEKNLLLAQEYFDKAKELQLKLPEKSFCLTM